MSSTNDNKIMAADNTDFTGDSGLFEAEDFFEMSLDNICIAGFDGYFKRVNPSWLKTLGWSLEELQAQQIIDFVHPEDRQQVLQSRENLKGGEALHRLINRYRCKDGSYRWFEWRAVANIERRLVYAVARDITEQKHAEAQLLEAQEYHQKLQNQLVFADRMASVGTLAAGVAHEINNPLAYLSANLKLMLLELDRLATQIDPEKLEELRDMAGDSSEGASRIAYIVDGLRTFSRQEIEELKPIDIPALLERSLAMAFNEIRHRARLVKDFQPIPHVDANESRLSQVFINLFLNAAQAIPEADRKDHEIRVVTATNHLGQAVIEVHDTGAGIPDAIVERIFDPFFTTKPVDQGTGLGLSLCHNIISVLGGTITVETREHRGTTFRITLPPSQILPTLDKETTIPTYSFITEVDEPITILVIIDDAALGRALKRTLHNEEVTLVQRASDALQLLHSGHSFDVIFSDLMMPHISGMEFYQELSAHFPHLLSKVVFLSEGSFTPSAKTFIDRIPNPILEKPFSLDQILECVTAVKTLSFRK